MVLAFAGLVVPGLHKFYLKQWRWGIVYLLLGVTHVSQIACLVEGIWYLSQPENVFNQNFNDSNRDGSDLNEANGAIAPSLTSMRPDALTHGLNLGANPVEAIADAVRQLETLRQDGLISEYEFEQKRRQLLDRIG